MSIEPEADKLGNKLGKLLKMLSSPRDGEVIAAARAILRTLEGAGADIHELARRVESGKLSEADMQRIYDAAYADGRRAAEKDKPTGFNDIEPNWHEMAINCRDQDNGRLTERERDFVNDMVRWTVHRKPSEKQGKWLHLLYVRLGRRRQ
jgi:hypothetical protein